MRNHPAVWSILLVGSVALTRTLFRSHYLYDVDSVHFGLALRRFDPATFQPHPPGYFLYVMLGRLVNAVIPDPNSALVAISIVASCGAAITIYLLTREWYGSDAGVLSVLLFLVSPLCWFHGTVALVYIVEAFLSGLIGLFCWKAYRGNTAYAVPASLVFALTAGFRPSSALLLGPLWLVSIWRLPWRARWLAAGVTALATLAWFIPMAQASGGVGRYFDSLYQLWSSVPGRRTTLSNPAFAPVRFIFIAWAAALCFGVASPLAFRRLRSESPAVAKERTAYVRVWILPGLLFFGLVFFNYVNSGYLLLLSPPAFAFLAVRAREFLRALSLKARCLVAATAIASNCAIFLFAPLYCTHAGVRRFESELTAVKRDLSRADPGKTLIIGFDSHFLGYRHAGYYLPQFVTVQYPEVARPGGKRVFIMRGGDTAVVRSFPIDQFERFIFFPLPQGADYRTYLETIRKRIPENAVRPIQLGNRTVLSGPARMIRMIFPSTASGAVYTAQHPGR